MNGIVAWCRAVPLTYRADPDRCWSGSEVLLPRAPASLRVHHAPVRANARPVAVAPGWSSVWLPRSQSPLLTRQAGVRAFARPCPSRLGVSVRHALRGRASLRTTGHSGLLSPSALRFHAPRSLRAAGASPWWTAESSLACPALSASHGYGCMHPRRFCRACPGRLRVSAASCEWLTSRFGLPAGNR